MGDDFEILCAALRCSPRQLQQATAYTRAYCIPHVIRRRRRSARPRVVWETVDPLRRIQRQIALWLKPHVAAQGEWVTAFRKDASALKNAQRHAGHAAVLTADLADFYGTISLEEVAALFESYGAGKQVALCLARLCTLDETLMQGGRASPFIANLVAARLDTSIMSRLREGCTYSRYVDDVTISGEKQALPSLADLRTWIEAAGFKMRASSACIKEKGAGPFVTGLNVADKMPRISRRTRRQIDRFFRFAARFDPDSAAQRTFRRGGRRADFGAVERYLIGVIDWVRPIDSKLSARWLEQLMGLREDAPL